MSEKLTIGIDIGGTRIKAGVIDGNGNLSSQINEPSHVDKDYSELLGKLQEIVEYYRSIGDSDVTGVGLAVAGLMDSERRVIIEAPNCASLVGNSLPDDLTGKVGLPTIMDNDANVMAVGEGISGAAQDSRHYIALTLGTGVGGAVISNGVLIRGIDGGGGELGHFPIDRRGPLCGCGARGCLEAYVGKAGIRRYIVRNHPQCKDVGLKEVNRAAIGGDEAASEVFAFIGRTLGVAVAGLVNIFNPELVVVGGGVAAAGELFLKPLRDEVNRRAFKAYLTSLEIRTAELGNWAGVIGAAAMARVLKDEG